MTKNLLIAVFALLILSSCGKFAQKATINRDCTGTYLEINNKDYFVCNSSIVSSFADGSKIRVKYRSLSVCEADNTPSVCELYHKHYGRIEITEIK